MIKVILLALILTLLLPTVAMAAEPEIWCWSHPQRSLTTICRLVDFDAGIICYSVYDINGVSISCVKIGS